MTTTIRDLRKWKADGKKFTMLTAYDYTTARWLDRAGIPVLLVGDSLGSTMLGYPDTLSVTMDDMIRHAGAVVRGAPNALVIGDLPFMAYHVSLEDTVRNAGRFLQEARVQAVKMEGGGRVIDYTRELTSMGIPVMAHLGLTPTFVNQFGGYRVQGRSDEAAEQILSDARALEAAGAFAVVLEGIPWPPCDRGPQCAHHRYRRRSAVRRAGARDPGRSRPQPRPRGQVRAPVRPTRPGHRGRRPPVRPGCQSGRLPHR